MYRAIEKLAEKLKEDFEEVEQENQVESRVLPKEKGSLTFIDQQIKLEVLSILNGLEFAGFSEKAKRKALEKLSSRIAELSRKELTPENLQKLGLYAFAVGMIKTRNFERLKEVEKL